MLAMRQPGTSHPFFIHCIAFSLPLPLLITSFSLSPSIYSSPHSVFSLVYVPSPILCSTLVLSACYYVS